MLSGNFKWTKINNHLRYIWLKKRVLVNMFDLWENWEERNNKTAILTYRRAVYSWLVHLKKLKLLSARFWIWNERSPYKDLGVPLISSRLNHLDCIVLKDHRILNRVQIWHSKFLSYAGRLQLIMSVLASLHASWSRIFVLPKRLLKTIDSILRLFYGVVLVWRKLLLKWHGLMFCSQKWRWAGDSCHCDGQ